MFVDVCCFSFTLPTVDRSILNPMNLLLSDQPTYPSEPTPRLLVAEDHGIFPLVDVPFGISTGHVTFCRPLSKSE